MDPSVRCQHLPFTVRRYLLLSYKQNVLVYLQLGNGKKKFFAAYISNDRIFIIIRFYGKASFHTAKNIITSERFCFMSKKSCPILYSKFLYKMGQDFLDIQ